MSTQPFTIDHYYDRANASDGVSRYGSYVRDRMHRFAESWDGTWDDGSTKAAEFAENSWRNATGPVMAPGYVRFHPRVMSAQVNRSGWDSSLLAAVELITGWPGPLAASQDWGGGRWWRDWPTESWGGEQQFLEPSEEDLTRHPYLLARCEMRFKLPMVALPAPPTGPDDDVEDTARRTVAVLVDELNRVVGPAITELENH